MSVLNFLHTKARAFVVFLFALISLGVFIISTLVAATVCQSWFGLIIGILLMIAAIPFHYMGKKHKTGYLISFVLNAVADGFSVSAYYLTVNIKLNMAEMLVSILPSVAILLLVYLLLQTFNKTKKVTVTIAVILNFLLTVLLTVLWIMHGDVIFSFGFFASLLSLFYLCVFGITINHDERSVLRDISFGSFGSFIILTVVVIFILSEGEILDGFDLDIGDLKKKKKQD